MQGVGQGTARGALLVKGGVQRGIQEGVQVATAAVVGVAKAGRVASTSSPFKGDKQPINTH